MPGDKTKLQDERRSNESSMRDVEKKPQMLSGGAKQIFRPRIIAMACIVSMGGFSMQSNHHVNTLANQIRSLRIRHWSDFRFFGDARLPPEVS
jgi:hypothetical protein